MLNLNWNRCNWCFFPATGTLSILRICRDVFDRSGAVLAVIALFFLTAQTYAGEIEPRSYVNTPVGVNFLIAGYSYSDGGLSTTASSPLEDAELKIHYGVLAYARALDICGKSGKIDVIVPYADLSGTAMVAGQQRERDVSGLNDPRLRFSVNFFGSPAVSLPEFANYRQDLIIGASLQVSAPLGQYDEDKLVNLGNNRWFFKPDIGISKAWGDFVTELSAGVFFFTDNDEFFGGTELEQEPVFTTQLHVTYNIGRGMWAALSGTYDYGGRTTVNGVENDDLQENSRVGATFAMPLNRNNSIKLFANTAIHTSIGNDYEMAGIVWQYRWGGGL
ncbi:MAG: transporter [Desulfococcaceae bacterium]